MQFSNDLAISFPFVVAFAAVRGPFYSLWTSPDKLINIWQQERLNRKQSRIHLPNNKITWLWAVPHLVLQHFQAQQHSVMIRNELCLPVAL